MEILSRVWGRVSPFSPTAKFAVTGEALTNLLVGEELHNDRQGQSNTQQHGQVSG